MKQKPTVSIRKKAMLAALEKSLGVVTTACKAIGISRETHYSWLEKDEKYKEAVNELDNIALDFAETKLHSNISKGSDTAIIFYLKTKGKKRGYIEKSEIDHTTNGESINKPLSMEEAKQRLAELMEGKS